MQNRKRSKSLPKCLSISKPIPLLNFKDKQLLDLKYKKDKNFNTLNLLHVQLISMCNAVDIERDEHLQCILLDHIIEIERRIIEIKNAKTITFLKRSADVKNKYASIYAKFKSPKT